MRIGIDLGGTKIESILLDGAGKELARKRVKTPNESYSKTINKIVSLVKEMETIAESACSVGVATPGALSLESGLIKNANSTCLNGNNLNLDLSDALQRPVLIANDANCFALSEATDGAGSHANNVFGVILGTGVGGGLVINGDVLTGKNNICGEWGHNPLPWPTSDEIPGPKCYCGQTGCIETFLSGPGLTKAHQIRTGLSVTAQKIAELYSEEHTARLTIEQYVNRLARALAHVVNLLDPDTIVLGGGLSNMEILYVQVPRLWSQYIFSDSITTELKRNEHGDSSGVRGAAWLWPG